MAERLFSDNHVWILISGENATIGITDHAQEKLGNIMFLNLPDVGESIVSGQRFGDIESIKTVSDLISPVSGEVIRVNEDLVDEPETINEAPYDSWFIEVKVAEISDDLMDEAAYFAKKDTI